MNILCRLGWHKLDRDYEPSWNVMRGTKCLRCGAYPFGPERKPLPAKAPSAPPPPPQWWIDKK